MSLHRTDSHPLPWLVAALLLGFGLTVVGIYFRLQAEHLERKDAIPSPAPARTEIDSSPFASANQTPPTQTLTTQRLVSVAQASADRAAVKLLSIAVADARAIQPLDRDSVGTGAPGVQMEVTFDLRGSYPAIKAWLAELLDRFDALVLVNLDLRSTEGTNPQGNTGSIGIGAGSVKVPATPGPAPVIAAATTQGQARMRWSIASAAPHLGSSPKPTEPAR